mmetsp:Transcript_66409/g.185058  ORF Transcript_66409/g.185058 Transcript_66409/m.185058 type:complete len:107 (+) Transcript_66409:515-835(+)
MPCFLKLFWLCVFPDIEPLLRNRSNVLQRDDFPRDSYDADDINSPSGFRKPFDVTDFSDSVDCIDLIECIDCGRQYAVLLEVLRLSHRASSARSSTLSLKKPLHRS